MPFYASLMLANTKEGEKKKKDECICIGPVFDSWVSSQRKAGAGRLPGQRGPAPAWAWPVPAPRASLTATYTNVFVKPKPRSASFLLPRILYVWQMTKSKQKKHTQTQNLQVCNIFDCKNILFACTQEPLQMAFCPCPHSTAHSLQNCSLPLR